MGLETMKPTYWLVLGICVLGALQAAACSSQNSCEDTRTCVRVDPSAAGSNGSGAEGGSVAQAGGGGDAGAGEGGTSDVPTLFGACSKLGAIVCQGAAAAQRLACDGEQWRAGTTCAQDELCDSGTGTCAKIVAGCAAAMPGQAVCRGDSPLTCGPDLVTSKLSEPCEGTCKDGACVAPSCGDTKLEEGEQCDDGDDATDGACPKCKLAACGDGLVRLGHEECDDGNNVAGDGCSPTCTWEAIAIAAGDAMTCALSAGGEVKCWGDGGQGALGQGDTLDRGDNAGEMGKALPPVALGLNRKAIAISAATAEACAILENGELKCWGNNLAGQLGTNDTNDRGDTPGEMGDALKAIPLGLGRTAKSVSQAGFQTCAILDDGTLKCWGSNAAGQLGLGDTADHYSPELLPPINLGTGFTAKSVSTGVGFNNCVVLDNDKAKCWGLSSTGALSLPIDSTDPVVGDAPNEIASLPTLNILGHAIRQIGVGTAFACALLDDSGVVTCWGTNNEGELGRDTTAKLGANSGELPALPGLVLGERVKSMSVAAFHTCVLLESGKVKCWGANARGQLGVGNTSNQGDGANEMAALPTVPLGKTAVQVSAGRQHSCALLADASVVCWGFNEKGQLGVGDTYNRLDSPSSPALKAVDLAF
jgi:cysteine-rich repeat protein